MLPSYDPLLGDNASSTDSLEVQIRAHLFLTWAEIAFAQEAVCNEVRHEAKAAKKVGGNLAPFMDGELRASILAITSAAFCLEAFAFELESLPGAESARQNARSMVEKARQESRKGRVPDDKLVLSYLKAGYNLDETATKTWPNDLRALYHTRGDAVHFKAKFHKPKSESFYGYGSSVHATFSRTAARRAVNTMVKVLTTCLANPTPASEPLKDWTEAAVKKLVSSRANDR
jgi:hypothetical protein